MYCNDTNAFIICYRNGDKIKADCGKFVSWVDFKCLTAHDGKRNRVKPIYIKKGVIMLFGNHCNVS